MGDHKVQLQEVEKQCTFNFMLFIAWVWEIYFVNHFCEVE